MTTRRALAVGGALLAATLFHAAHLHAQQGPPPAGAESRGAPRGDRRGPPSIDQHVQRMTAELNLTPEQVTRVRALVTAERARADSLHARAQSSREADRKAMGAMHEDMQKSLDAILTPEQRAKHAELMKQRDHAGGRRMRGGARRGGRGDARGDQRGPSGPAAHDHH